MFCKMANKGKFTCYCVVVILMVLVHELDYYIYGVMNIIEKTINRSLSECHGPLNNAQAY